MSRQAGDSNIRYLPTRRKKTEPPINQPFKKLVIALIIETEVEAFNCILVFKSKFDLRLPGFYIRDAETRTYSEPEIIKKIEEIFHGPSFNLPLHNIRFFDSCYLDEDQKLIKVYIAAPGTNIIQYVKNNMTKFQLLPYQNEDDRLTQRFKFLKEEDKSIISKYIRRATGRNIVQVVFGRP